MKFFLSVFSLLLFSSVWAEGDVDAGQQKAVTCAGCHGSEGISSVPTFPNLAGQKQAYIEASLKAFRAKERTGNQAAIMYGMAAPLSDEDISDLAAYFSNLEP